MRARIESRLRSEFGEKINLLEVIDNSHLHAGHVGARDSGETHFKIIIKSDQLAQLNRIAAHRLINQILKDELKQIHALEIKILK